MPARTKGFMDRVMFPGSAYAYRNANRTLMRPLWGSLEGVTVITTMNTPGWLYAALFGNAIKKALLLGTFWKMGYRRLKWLSFNRVKDVSAEKRTRWLVRIEQRFAALGATRRVRAR